MSDSPANAEQIEYWNSASGEMWVTSDDALHACLAPIKQRLLERTALQAGERVMDVGCGTGATTMDLASRAGPAGMVLGVDVSRSLLDKAKTRTAQAGIGNVEYILADAQTHDFQSADFDLMASRFGVMFFADPVAAFRNIASALKPGGRMAFVSWGALEKNPWFYLPRDFAVARLGKPSPAPPNAPGPFAFQEPARVLNILSDAGLSDISASVENIPLTPKGTLEEVAKLACILGPAARTIREKGGNPSDIGAIEEKVAEALEVYAADGGYPVPATVNFFDAIRP